MGHYAPFALVLKAVSGSADLLKHRLTYWLLSLSYGPNMLQLTINELWKLRPAEQSLKPSFHRGFPLINFN